MYKAPISDIAFTLKHVCGLGDVPPREGAEALGDDLLEAILGEAGRFAADEIAPMNKVADREPPVLQNGVVTTPDGWKELYKAWAEGGWNSLTAAPEFGGQGLPMMLNSAVLEMWNSGSMAFAIGPTLTMGAVEALEKHASPALQAIYLEKLVSGEWTGTMNLTEPQAGSDLNALKAKAVRQDDGTYRISGQKIFITYGEHDMSDNIVHLVLARLPDAPAGTRGISLFLVPKFIPDGNGTPGARNDVRCAGLEHKMGIHGSPTCTMVYGDDGGATGWLIGEENRGLACMFTMMNNARLAVGIQGLGVAERAYQQALAYALDRQQGRAPGDKAPGMSAIARHPDVKRMLLTMKAKTQVARAICYLCANAIDRAATAREPDERTYWSDRAGLLTPIAKALSTDFGSEVASLGVQIHGGMGYIEETGAAQHLRDARIAAIYEGTNGIQAIDLVMRKLPLGDGKHVLSFMDELEGLADLAASPGNDGLDGLVGPLKRALADWREVTLWLQDQLKAGNSEAVLAGATPYLRLAGLTLGAALLLKGAMKSIEVAPERAADRALLAHFFATAVLGEAVGLKADVMASGASVLAFDAQEQGLLV